MAISSGVTSCAPSASEGNGWSFEAIPASRASDTIDPRVGFSELLAVGTPVERHQPLAVVHAASDAAAEAALHALAAAITIADTATTTPLIHASVGA